MLKRYWFILYPDFPFGPGNIGVTAYSKLQAASIIKDELGKLHWNHITDTMIDEAQIIEDIDINSLDQNHVIPNIGVVVFEGVWFPNLGLQ